MSYPHTDIEREKAETCADHWILWTAPAFIPMEDKAYSWWSYRNRDWKKSNRGRRLDHIWLTPALKTNLKSYEMYADARDWVKPSDHAPIMIDLSHG